MSSILPNYQFDKTSKTPYRRRYHTLIDPGQKGHQSVQKQKLYFKNRIYMSIDPGQKQKIIQKQHDDFNHSYKQAAFILPNFNANKPEITIYPIFEDQSAHINNNIKDSHNPHNNNKNLPQQSLSKITLRRGRLRTLQSQPKYNKLNNRGSLYSINNSIEKQKEAHYNNNKVDSRNNIYVHQQTNSQGVGTINNQNKKSSENIINNSRKNSFLMSKNRFLAYENNKKSIEKISITHKNVHSYSRNIQKQAFSLQNQKKKQRSHSQSYTSVIDNNLDKLIKKQFSSIDINQIIPQQPHRNPLDQGYYLTQYQKQQVKNYKQVYYLGHKAYLRKYKQNFRDSKDNYKPIIGDHIAYRFQIVKILGSGAFGKVLQVIDHKQPENKRKKYALKILKKSQDLYNQFKLQINILKIVKQNSQAIKNVVQIKGDFQFRTHLCIVTELLSMNIYSYIKSQQFSGMSLQIVRKIIIQVLQSLLFLHHKQIIHCDIKPENIVFKQYGKSGIKLIDFGSACFVDKKQFTYIQSRYYRSPEIVLVKPYDEKIDIWSTGCLAYEMFTGAPLFPARCESEQIAMLKQTLGCPPEYFLNRCQRSDEFSFQKNYKPLFPLSKRINSQISSQAFIDFMQKTIRWSPQERLSAEQALMHEFILQGLPHNVREEHVQQMKGNNPYGLYLQ